jgi:hypothetical protein
MKAETSLEAAKAMVFVTFMQHGFEKARFGRISGIC